MILMSSVHVLGESSVVSKSTRSLENHVQIFMKGLPNATIVNITILGPDYSGFLQQMPIPPTTKAQAWLLVSRICSNEVTLKVAYTVFQHFTVDIDWKRLPRPLLYKWSCPWEGLNMVDKLAGSFRALVEEFDLRSTYHDIVPNELHRRFDTFLRCSHGRVYRH